MSIRKLPKNQEILQKFLDSVVTGRLFSHQDEAVFTPSTDLVFHVEEDTFYFYNNGAYRRFLHNDLASIFNVFLHKNFPDINLSRYKITELIDLLILTVPRRFYESDSRYIAFNDNLFDTLAPQGSDRLLFPHDREKIAFFSFPFGFVDTEMPTPTFDSYLKTTFPSSTELQDFVVEMLGFFLLPKTKTPAAFFLVGDGKNGKSVFLDLLEHLIGPEYVSSFSLEALTSNRFTAAELIGKKVNIVNEDESKFMSVDRFKAMVSGDKIHAERKYGVPFSFRPKTKFIFASNNPPTFRDINLGLKRRLHVVPFKVTFDGDTQDPDILAKLKTEIPGIVGKALKSARAFLDRQEVFELPPEVLAAKDAFVADSSSAIAFLLENYKTTDPKDVDKMMDHSDIYDDYKWWARDVGHKPCSAKKFWCDVTGNIPDMIENSIKSNGKKVRNLERTAAFDNMIREKQYDKVTENN